MFNTYSVYKYKNISIKAIKVSLYTNRFKRSKVFYAIGRVTIKVVPILYSEVKVIVPPSLLIASFTR